MTQASNASDPIVADVHQARQQLLKEHGGFAGLMAFLGRPKDEKQPCAPTTGKTSEEHSESKLPPS